MDNKQLDNLRVSILIIFVVEAVLALVLEFLFYMRFATVMLVCVVFDGIYVSWVLSVIQDAQLKRSKKIREVVDEEFTDAVLFGNVGIVIFDEQFNITWMSDLFTGQGIDYTGEKVSMWIPETKELFSDEVDSIQIAYEGKTYEVQRVSQAQCLFFRDITEEAGLKEEKRRSAAVVGLINLDNYSETVQYEDEQKISRINSDIRQRVADWCSEKGMMSRRIRADRYVVFTDYEHFSKALEERFSILNEVRKESEKLEVSITLSMAFAYGTKDYVELGNMANDLLELAQNRGGDQAAVRAYGSDVQFIGGTTETSEKRSGVRIRVMAQSVRGMMEESDRILVVGHRMADFDCFGGMLGISRMASSLGREVYVVSEGMEMEEKLAGAFARFRSALEPFHRFISQDEALTLLTGRTLVVVVDHHTEDLCATPEVPRSAKRILVIDHHRRRRDDNIHATMVYLEASASSTVELVTEFLQYQPKKVELLQEEANIMFAGMVVDTNHFRARCGSRTFEAASALRDWGADPLAVDDLLKNTYREFQTLNKIFSYSQRIEDKYIIVPIASDETYSRAQLSEAADFLLSVQGVKASFVIARLDESTIAVSARSAGEINVQLIMEQMQGGGHFTAAALQRKDTTVEEITSELADTIRWYEEEAKKENESDHAE